MKSTCLFIAQALRHNSILDNISTAFLYTSYRPFVAYLAFQLQSDAIFRAWRGGLKDALTDLRYLQQHKRPVRGSGYGPEQ